jgi:tight adherence protein B
MLPMSPAPRTADSEAAMDIQILALCSLVTVAVGGVAWVFIYPLLSGEREAEKRVAGVARPDPVSRATTQRAAQRSRREQVEESLKELELRQTKAKKLPLSMRINRAGLTWSKQQFWLISAMLGAVAVGAAFFVGAGLLPALGFGFAAGLGVPRWLLSFLKKRRETKFLDGFPDAVDVIVRGIKAGLPLIESMKIVSNDAPEPIKGEFRSILETQTIGIPVGEACAKLYERIPLPEANFFGIVITIQQKSGGNLSEALGNLSRVLRDRKKMKAKIQAMSKGVKASAAIIGALPIAVMVMISITTPDYIELLWTHPIGRMMLAGCAGWMLIGVLVMKKMINFDF